MPVSSKAAFAAIAIMFSKNIFKLVQDVKLESCGKKFTLSHTVPI